MMRQQQFLLDVSLPALDSQRRPHRASVTGALHVPEDSMSDLNKVMLIGRIGAKPELKTTQAGDAICKLRLATSYGTQQDGKFERETLWHSVVVFGRQAENCAENLDKGRLVYVEGTLRPDEWTDKSGAVHHAREVRASHVSFLGPKVKADSQAQAA